MIGNNDFSFLQTGGGKSAGTSGYATIINRGVINIFHYLRLTDKCLGKPELKPLYAPRICSGRQVFPGSDFIYQDHVVRLLSVCL